jgi:uncharacterized membrane protein YgcG
LNSELSSHAVYIICIMYKLYIYFFFAGLSTKGDPKKSAVPKPLPLPDNAIVMAPTLLATDKRCAHLVEGEGWEFVFDKIGREGGRGKRGGERGEGGERGKGGGGERGEGGRGHVHLPESAYSLH